MKLMFIWTAIKKRQVMLYIWYYRALFCILGVKYGKKCIVQGRIYISGKGKVSVGDNFKFTTSGYLNPLSRNIKGSMFTTRESSVIQIGDNVGISSSCLWAQDKIVIGNNVNIGADCIIMDNDAHPLDYEKRRADYLKNVGWSDYLNNVSSSPIYIGDDVWIGSRCQILKGVKIGARSIIAAGSIVTKDIPSDVIAGGIPCHVIRYI